LVKKKSVKKSAWKGHKAKTVSGKLLAEQKRLAKKKDTISKIGAVSAGGVGGVVAPFEAASDILPGKRFQGRRHQVPDLLDEDTTWAFRMGTAITMATPSTGLVAPVARGARVVSRAVRGGKTLKPGVYKGGKLVKQTAAEKARGAKYMKELAQARAAGRQAASLPGVKNLGGKANVRKSKFGGARTTKLTDETASRLGQLKAANAAAKALAKQKKIAKKLPDDLLGLKRQAGRNPKAERRVAAQKTEGLRRLRQMRKERPPGFSGV